MRADVAAVIASLGGVERVAPSGVLVPSLTGESGLGEKREPVYPRAVRDDIQGNIVPGFNKDHQHFLFLTIEDVSKARRWLRRLAPSLTTMDDALAFVRAHRSARLRTGDTEPPLNATWINIAFSYPGVLKLAGKQEADEFGDESFRQGLAERSTYLGDPSSPRHPNHRTRWKVGGPGAEADIFVMVAADQPSDLKFAVKELMDGFDGVAFLYGQRCDTLPGNLRGHEHFGFKDGISQPGVRGRVSNAAGDFLTPRYLTAEDPHARLFAKPGQPLVWPGQFLLGEPRQDTQDLYAPARAAKNFPAWAKRGSYVVVRRLRQDVEAFWTFVADHAGPLDPIAFAATLVGRWPSGAPLMRGADDPALAGDEFANNHFLFEDPTRRSALALEGYAGDRFPPAPGDVAGAICPHFAHIRKVNPRDGGTDLGTPADSLLRLMLRRGIPFGPPVAGVASPSPALLARERGLMFVAFAATIEDQFEFITRKWANSTLHPRGGGHDPIMGQADRCGDRTRVVGSMSLDSEWVGVTGGGYFFAPPVSAVAGVLAGAL